MQTSVGERRDTLAELPPLAGGSGNSAGSGRRTSRPQPSPRGGSLQGRSDLFARMPAVLRTRSGGPLEVLSCRYACGLPQLCIEAAEDHACVAGALHAQCMVMHLVSQGHAATPEVVLLVVWLLSAALCREWRLGRCLARVPLVGLPTGKESCWHSRRLLLAAC
jgi:hypothetical protein